MIKIRTALCTYLRRGFDRCDSVTESKLPSFSFVNSASSYIAVEQNSFVIQRSSDGRTDGMREESAERKEERRESNQPTNQPTDQTIERPYTKLFWLRVISGIVVKSSCQFSLV